MTSTFLIYIAGVSLAAFVMGCQGSEFSDGGVSASQQTIDASATNLEEGTIGEAVTYGRRALDDEMPSLELQEFMVSESKKPVDIFFVMDTSGSMLQEKADLEANMKGFMAALDAGMIDAKVTAIGSSSFNFPADISADRFRVIDQTVGSYNAIDVLNRVFASNALPLPLRDNAGLEVVFITDDDGRGTGNLAANFNAPKKAVVNGIVGLKKGQDASNVNCNVVRIGREYMTLAKNSGGNVFDLCAKDWNAMLQKLSESIKVRNRGFKLDKKAKAGGKLSVKLDGRELDKSSFEFDATNNAVLLRDDLEFGLGAKVQVEFERD